MDLDRQTFGWDLIVELVGEIGGKIVARMLQIQLRFTRGREKKGESLIMVRNNIPIGPLFRSRRGAFHPILVPFV